jgi:hypothetical protein
MRTPPQDPPTPNATISVATESAQPAVKGYPKLVPQTGGGVGQAGPIVPLPNQKGK